MHPFFTFVALFFLLIVNRTESVFGQQPDPIMNPESWVYENVYRDGDLQYQSIRELASEKHGDYVPFTHFLDQKLGCEKGVSSERYNLAVDFSWNISGGYSELGLTRKHYAVGYASAFGNGLSMGLVILDVKNHWTAFAMTHSEDFWNYTDGGWRRRQFSEEFQKHFYIPHFSLFLVDDSSNQFNSDAEALAREWVEKFSLTKGYVSQYQDLRFYADDLPMKIYEIKCDRQR